MFFCSAAAHPTHLVDRNWRSATHAPHAPQPNLITCRRLFVVYSPSGVVINSTSYSRAAIYSFLKEHRGLTVACGINNYPAKTVSPNAARHIVNDTIILTMVCLFSGALQGALSRNIRAGYSMG